MTEVRSQVANLGNQVSQLDKRIADVDRKASGGVAIALAMASPVSLAQGESAVSVGAGGFGGQGAVAVSFSHSFKLEGNKKAVKKGNLDANGNEILEVIEGNEPIFKEAMFSVGAGGSTAGETGVRASMTFKF